MEEKFITIPNLSEYIHYSARHIVWFKTYLDILQNPSFCRLTNAERWFYFGLIILAIRNNNAIPYDLGYVKQQISNGKFSENSFKKMAELALIAIEPLERCYPVASTIREDKSREEEKTEEEKKLEEDLTSWNNNQSRPIEEFKAMNIIKKHGVGKIRRLVEECGNLNNGFDTFLVRLKEEQ